MAAKQARRTRGRVDYRQLDAISSVVLYDSRPANRSRFYEVERILERRKVKNGYEYLLKWKGWPYYACSWEPEDNLTVDLLRSYENPPKPTDVRLEDACRNFHCSILSSLKSSRMTPTYIEMHLDIWRWGTRQRGVPSKHRGHVMLEKEDLSRFPLPCHWYYWLDIHGQDMAVDFPLKAKPLLSMTANHYCVSGQDLVQAPRVPTEKIVVSFSKRACDLTNL